MVCYPMLITPQSTTSSVAHSAIPMGELHIEDQTHGGGFKFLITRRAAAKTNKASAKMLTTELGRMKELLAPTKGCAFHVRNTADIWGG